MSLFFRNTKALLLVLVGILVLLATSHASNLRAASLYECYVGPAKTERCCGYIKKKSLDSYSCGGGCRLKKKMCSNKEMTKYADCSELEYKPKDLQPNQRQAWTCSQGDAIFPCCGTPSGECKLLQAIAYQSVF